MPEATIYKNNSLIFGENNVRSAGKSTVVLSISESFSKQRLSNYFFWLCVLSFDAGHIVTSCLFIMYIHCYQDGYVKDKTSRFNRLKSQLNCISTEEQKRLFGEVLPEVDLVFDSALKHPLVVLREAVEYYEDYRQGIIKQKEAEAAKTEEERQRETELKKMMYEKAMELSAKNSYSYPPPPEITTEQRVFIEGKNIGIDLEGSLLLSCCNQYRLYFERGSKGRTILSCPQCHRYVVVDYTKKTSESLDTIKYSKFINDIS